MKYTSREPLTPAARAICARLRAEIIRAGWTETARRSGIERTALHRAFRDGRNPHFSTVAVVAEALGLELALTARAQ